MVQTYTLHCFYITQVQAIKDTYVTKELQMYGI